VSEDALFVGLRVQLNSNNASEALQAEFTEAETNCAPRAKDYGLPGQERHGRGPIRPSRAWSGNILAFTGKLTMHAPRDFELGAKIAEMKKEQNEDRLSNPSS